MLAIPEVDAEALPQSVVIKRCCGGLSVGVPWYANAAPYRILPLARCGRLLGPSIHQDRQATYQIAILQQHELFCTHVLGDILIV